MRLHWNELVIVFYDRMAGFVATAHNDRLDAHEEELAVQIAMIRFADRVIDTFDGVSMGQLVNYCKKLAAGVCIDVQRKASRHTSHAGVSLDEGWDLDPDEARTPGWEGAEAAHRFELDESSADTRDFLKWALPQLKESRRRVVEMSLAGAELPEICEELDLTPGNAYQLRSRGNRDLRELKEKWDA